MEALQLAQQATLETRDAKHEPRTLTEQRTTWHAQAAETLGGPDAVQAMITQLSTPARRRARPWTRSGWRRPRRECWRRWRNGARPGRAGMSAPKHNARSGPHKLPPTKWISWWSCSSTEVLHTRSVSLTRPDDGISEPAALRRVDGSSVYTVAGSELFTSTRILAAEQRLVATAGRTDGRVLDAGTVELALLESAANGNSLRCWAGRSGSFHVQLRGAAATRHRPRRRRENHRYAHSGSGVARQRRPVVGLAPSAAAAAQLHDATGAPAETLAKLTWSIHHNDLPDWVERIGRSTLVIIDEAGMADTLSLDTAVQFIIGRGGSIRLIGDDQQLAAIGAGGVLRDIEAVMARSG